MEHQSRAFVLAGTSSGAHLALLYTYTSKEQNSAIIDFCGPTDLTDTAVLAYSVKVGLKPAIVRMTGKNYTVGQQLDSAYVKSSPVKKIKSIPVLIIHGTTDQVVNYSQSKELNDSLTKMNIDHRLLTIQNANHDLNGKDPSTKNRIYQTTIQWILAHTIVNL